MEYEGKHTCPYCGFTNVNALTFEDCPQNPANWVDKEGEGTIFLDHVDDADITNPPEEVQWVELI